MRELEPVRVHSSEIESLICFIPVNAFRIARNSSCICCWDVFCMGNQSVKYKIFIGSYRVVSKSPSNWHEDDDQSRGVDWSQLTECLILSWKSETPSNFWSIPGLRGSNPRESNGLIITMIRMTEKQDTDAPYLTLGTTPLWEKVSQVHLNPHKP